MTRHEVIGRSEEGAEESSAAPVGRRRCRRWLGRAWGR